MQFWDTVVNTAMMGTDKKQISVADVPSSLGNAMSVIFENSGLDREEVFLQVAAVGMNYRQCGTLPLQKNIQLQPAPTEVKSYCSSRATQTIIDILDIESLTLLKLWLDHCSRRQQIAEPFLIPRLFPIAAAHRKLQPLITLVGGHRGEWLSNFNPVWKFISHKNDDEIWQTGTALERRELLNRIRLTSPAKAKDLLQQTWAQEDAATKTAFLELLADNLNADDIPFLENLSTEKSKKVRETDDHLLKKIPGSQIVLMYEVILRQAVVLKKEKALMGLLNKTFLFYQLALPSDHPVFKTGIDQLSNSKEFTDEEYIIGQLVAAVPPAFWESHFEKTPQQIIQLLQDDPLGKMLMPSLVTAITTFGDHRWAIQLMQHSLVFYLDIIPLLPAAQQNSYSNKFFDQFPHQVISHAIGRETEWDHELAKNIIRFAAKNHYQYNRSFFNQHITLIPVSIIGDLQYCAPEEAYLKDSWLTTSNYISRLLVLKSEIFKEFT